jgi:hypothetical protein
MVNMTNIDKTGLTEWSQQSQIFLTQTETSQKAEKNSTLLRSILFDLRKAALVKTAPMPAEAPPL